MFVLLNYVTVWKQIIIIIIIIINIIIIIK